MLVKPAAASNRVETLLVRSLKNEITRIDPYARVNVVEPGWTKTHMARPALQQDDVVRNGHANLGICDAMDEMTSCLAGRETLEFTPELTTRLESYADDYESNVIRRHENTLVEKRRDRRNLALALNAHSGPVFLTYHADANIYRFRKRN